MSDELFSMEAVAMDSPRIAWIKKHGVELHEHVGFPEPWCASFGDPVAAIEKDGGNAVGYGATMHEAIVNLATNHGVKLWNEETG